MEKSATGGICSMFLVFIVFLVLKLTNVIGWSWWWIASPLWAPLLISIIVILCSIIVIRMKVKGQIRKYRN